MQLIYSTLKGLHMLDIPRLLPVPGKIQEFYQIVGPRVERDTETNFKAEKSLISIINMKLGGVEV